LPTIAPPEIAPTIALSSPSPIPVAPARRPKPEPRVAVQSPSFSCSGRKSWAEQSVCTSASLAALDRTMASLWGDAMERANPSQRASLLASDRRFIASRNQCASESCVGDAYLAGIGNIRTIMSGTALPR
jgi:uncharacterized protein